MFDQVDGYPDSGTPIPGKRRSKTTVRPVARKDLPSPTDEPGVIVVPYRSPQGSARLFPPILILMAGLLFLVYRSHTSDWRGLSALFETRVKASPEPLAAAGSLLVENAEPAKNAEVPAVVSAPVEPLTATVEKESPDPMKPEPMPELKVNPLDDIEREAEKTRERIAELERLKDRESQKLDESAGQRQRADEFARRRNPKARQLEQLRQQIARFEQMRLKQMQNGFFNAPMPPAPGIIPGPNLGRGGMFAMPGDVPAFPPGGVPAFPPGGVVRTWKFRDPNGMTAWGMTWRSGDQVPPPPQPAQPGTDNGVPPDPPRPFRGARRFD